MNLSRKLEYNKIGALNLQGWVLPYYNVIHLTNAMLGGLFYINTANN